MTASLTVFRIITPYYYYTYCDHHHYQQLEDSKFFVKLGSDEVKYLILMFTYHIINTHFSLPVQLQQLNTH